MNTQSRHCLISLCLGLLAAFQPFDSRAAEAPGRAVGIVIDCARPALPSQQDVGELLGQHNFSQVYATRGRLMAEARRACRRNGTAKVLVQQSRRTEQNAVAATAPAR